MNRDDVLRVAKECGLDSPVPFIDSSPYASKLERFAAAIGALYYADGAEDMRERAELACNTVKSDDDGWDDGLWNNAIGGCQSVIRALPITPTNTEGEQG